MKIKDFFRYWSNVDKDDLDLKVTLYEFYIKNGFGEFLVPATNLINSTTLPHREFQKLTSSSRLQGLGNPSYILHLINYRPFVESLNTRQKKKYVIDYLNESNSYKLERADLNRSLLYNSIIADEEDSDPN